MTRGRRAVAVFVVCVVVVARLGVAGFDVSAWDAIFAPAVAA